VVHQELLAKGPFNLVADPTATLTVPKNVSNGVITAINPSGLFERPTVEARLLHQLLEFIDGQCKRQMPLLRRLVAVLVVDCPRRTDRTRLPDSQV